MKMFLALATIASLISFGALADCVEPASPADPPIGATATRDEMLAAQLAIKTYNSAVVEYTACLEGTRGAAAKVNEVVARLESLAERFNAELRAFKQRNGG